MNMERDYMDGKENVYLACRKKAAEYNDKLNSREMAAELLGFSTSTLANYELGVTKNVPPDSVVMMSDLYKQPELKNYYCKHECPIGKNFPLAVKESGLQGITVKILNSLDDDDYDTTLMEPVSLPCNVSGGIGFVGIATPREVVITFPERPCRNTSSSSL